MHVQVDQARNNVFAGGIDLFTALRERGTLRGPAARIFSPSITTMESGAGACPLPSIRTPPIRATAGGDETLEGPQPAIPTSDNRPERIRAE